MMGGVIAMLFGLALPLVFGHGLVRWPWILAGIFWAWAILAPGTLDPVYHLWMRFGLVMGFINTRIILGLVFYGLVWPMGLVMGLIGYDPLHRKMEEVATYRVSTQPRLKESMENPY